VDPTVQGFGYLGVDGRTESDDTTERGLNVAPRTAEPVVEVEVAKGGVEVVTPHQADDAAAKPDTFRVASGAVDRLRGFDEFIDLALTVLGGIRRRGLGLFGLIGGPLIATLGSRDA